MSSVNLQTKKNYVISQLGEDFIDAGSCEIRYQCPFCMEQGHTYEDYKLYVNYAKLVYWCHRCETTGAIEADEIIPVIGVPVASKTVTAPVSPKSSSAPGPVVNINL